MNKPKTMNTSQEHPELSNWEERCEMALSLVDHGFYIFPIAPLSKRGFFGSSWPILTTNKRKRAEQYLVNYKGCNIGIHLKLSKLAVVDIDVKNEQRGLESLKALENTPKALDSNFIVKTPSGGLHLYFYDKLVEIPCKPPKVDFLGAGIENKKPTPKRAGFKITP